MGKPEPRYPDIQSALVYYAEEMDAYLADLEARMERMRDAVEDVEQQFHAQELADKLNDGPCPKYKSASVYLDISKARSALADSSQADKEATNGKA